MIRSNGKGRSILRRNFHEKMGIPLKLLPRTTPCPFRKGCLCFFLLLLSTLTLSCSTDPEYHRVEEFPEGMNTDLWESATHRRLHTTHVSNRYRADYPEVWEATLKVARNFEKRYGKPILHIEPKKGEIRFSDTNLFDRKEIYSNVEAERLQGWKEQVQIKVRKMGDGLIKVTVYRTVEGMVYFGLNPVAAVRNYRKYLEPEISNGELEDWFLTKIEDNLAASPTQTS